MDCARILLADGDADLRDAYARILRDVGHSVETAADGTEAVDKIRAAGFDLVLTDLVIPPCDGLRILEEVKRIRPSTLVVVFSALASLESVLAAFRSGAHDFLTKPLEVDALRDLVERVLALRRAGEARRRIGEQLECERMRVTELSRQLGWGDPFERIVGSSVSVRRLVESLREVARTDATVLLSGESGTGKGLAARAIHGASARCGGPFVEANCVVYAEDVLHGELFGRERGALTSAERSKPGRFELARGGTLFLDEIGGISPTTQTLLLRVLQERVFERVGGEETLEVDVRLIAATNSDLEEAVSQGRFRVDLFYRLNVIPIRVSPLRDRPEDVPILAHHFLRRAAERVGRSVAGFDPVAMDALARYSWPGNVRELENLVERLVVLARRELIQWRDLPRGVRDGGNATAGREAAGTLQELERRRIMEALEEAGGNKKLAASILGIHRSTLYAKIERYGLAADRAVTRS